MRKVNKVEAPFDRDYEYEIEYIYDYEYSCEESGCNDAGICRCGRIINFQITDVKHAEIANGTFTTIESNIGRSLSDIEKYAIERYLAHSLTADSFTADISSGYYDEELESVRLIDYATLWEEIQSLLALTTDLEKIYSVLTLEYGKIADTIANKTQACVINIKLGDIEIPSESRRNAVANNPNVYDSKRFVQLHSNGKMVKKLATCITMPVAVVREKNGKFVLVDGYTRIGALKGQFTDTTSVDVVDLI